MTKVICIIPARNEASRVSRVVEVALAAEVIDAVWVVDNCSTDDTAGVAKAAGAKVLHCATLGKGNAVAHAIKELADDNDVIVMLDADLVGLRVDHVEQLIHPVVSGGYIQAGGVTDDHWSKHLYWRWYIGLTGQRAFRAGLLWEIDELDYQGWALEVALNSICRWSPIRRKRQIAKVFLDGVSDTPKELKYPSSAAAKIAKRAVFSQWFKGLIRFNLSVRVKPWLR